MQIIQRAKQIIAAGVFCGTDSLNDAAERIRKHFKSMMPRGLAFDDFLSKKPGGFYYFDDIPQALIEKAEKYEQRDDYQNAERYFAYAVIYTVNYFSKVFKICEAPPLNPQSSILNPQIKVLRQDLILQAAEQLDDYQQNELAKILACYKTALERHTWVCMKLKKYLQTAKNYKQLLALIPDNSEYRMQYEELVKGESYQAELKQDATRQNDTKEAIILTIRSLSLTTRELIRQTNYEEAIVNAKKCLALVNKKQQKIRQLYCLVNCLMRLYRSQEAIMFLKQIHELDSTNQQCLITLVENLVQLNNFSEAKFYYEKLDSLVDKDSNETRDLYRLSALIYKREQAFLDVSSRSNHASFFDEEISASMAAWKKQLVGTYMVIASFYRIEREFNEAVSQGANEKQAIVNIVRLFDGRAGGKSLHGATDDSTDNLAILAEQMRHVIKAKSIRRL